MKRCLPCLLIAAGLAATASADGLAVSLDPIGMPSGLSGEVIKRLSPRFNVRLGGGIPAEPTAKNIEFGDVHYDMTLKLGGVNASVDWYPFGGRFRLSGGVVTQRSPWSLRSTSVSSYRVNGVDYPAADVGTLTGEVRFQHQIAPALLVDWGNPVAAGKHLGFVLDLGAAYVGRQDFVLHASGPLASDPAFRKDLAAEEKLRSAGHAFVPVLKVGISYQF